MDKEKIQILVTGDYHITNFFTDYIKTLNKPESVFGNLIGTIKESDIAITNIEFPVTKRNKQILKVGMTAKTNPISLKPLKNSGFNLATIGNNHSFDYRNEGVIDTINNCNLYGLDTVGAGKNYQEARKIYYKIVKGRKIAVLNFSENEFNVATNEHGGANPLNIIDNVKDIQLARNNADFIFIIIHGGPDFCHYPTTRMVKQYRFYAEQGASAIICHHTHFVSGYEVHNGVPILYGLGNFIYPIIRQEETITTLIVKFTIDNDNILSFDILPYKFNLDKYVLKPIIGKEKDIFDKKMNELCSSLKDLEYLKRKWGEHIVNNEDYVRYFVVLSNLPYIVFKIFKRFKLLPLLQKILLLNKLRFIHLWNLIRCETHRDALLYFFREMFKDDEKVVNRLSKIKKFVFNVSREETH